MANLEQALSTPATSEPVPGPQLPGAISDKERIEATARRQLRRSAYPQVREVSCRYHNGVLVLEGTLPSFYLKQIAQAQVLHRLEGIVKVRNQVEVVPTR